ncbi:MAG: IS200/IS605 family transposase [Cytophagaceae bacterium]|nr:IS200/IS605 family transposase [Cytophagaceae bacterium]
MSDTYTQIHIQVVFAVKYRQCLIEKEWKSDLYDYITAIIHNNNHKVIAINGMPDHIHIFFGMRPAQSLSNLMQDIKASSSKWINEKQLTKRRFRWQAGYGAFSYSKSQLSKVAAYVDNQEEHHKEKSMLVEYREFLQKFEIDYNEAYIFHDPM